MAAGGSGRLGGHGLQLFVFSGRHGQVEDADHADWGGGAQEDVYGGDGRVVEAGWSEGVLQGVWDHGVEVGAELGVYLYGV